ncbi:hypothetical protein DL98DRAFT_609946 [Cadophora sp. DSE1049]|nr:hypothetical protein DL98DRAFT_609946 [Cadophora sp. DSE1049]
MLSMASGASSDVLLWQRNSAKLDRSQTIAGPGGETLMSPNLLLTLLLQHLLCSVPLDTNAGNYCSNHPSVICGLSSDSNAPGVYFDCPKVGPVNGDTIWWKEGREMSFAEPSAEEKEGNGYVTERDYQGYDHRGQFVVDKHRMAVIYESQHEI